MPERAAAVRRPTPRSPRRWRRSSRTCRRCRTRCRPASPPWSPAPWPRIRPSATPTARSSPTALRGAADGADPAPALDQTRVIAATPPPTSTTRVTTTSGGARSRSRQQPGRRSRWPLYAAIALALILLGALLIASPWSDDESTGGNDPAADTVKVDKAAYVGEPVDEVESALGDKGLETEVETIDNPGDEEAGTVADLSPTGKVAKGELITLEVWDDPPAPETEEPDNSGEGRRGAEAREDRGAQAGEDRGAQAGQGQAARTQAVAKARPTSSPRAPRSTPLRPSEPGSSARQGPDQGTEQSGTGKGD